jgi:hypothetical protein
MTGEETMRHIREDTPLNKLRALFSSECGRIEQAGMQRTPLGPVEMRAMEFDAIARIMRAAGMTLDEFGALLREHEVEAFTLRVERGCWVASVRRGHAVTCGRLSASAEAAILDALHFDQTPVPNEDVFG